jgi:hypothetical protein
MEGLYRRQMPKNLVHLRQEDMHWGNPSVKPAPVHEMWVAVPMTHRWPSREPPQAMVRFVR